MDSERARQSSLVSRPYNHLARTNNGACVPEKIPICKKSVAEIRAADAMSAFMWCREREGRKERTIDVGW